MAGKGFGVFKEALSALLVDQAGVRLLPRAQRLLADPSGGWTRCCAMVPKRAAAIADPIVAEAERLVGFPAGVSVAFTGFWTGAGRS